MWKVLLNAVREGLRRLEVVGSPHKVVGSGPVRGSGANGDGWFVVRKCGGLPVVLKGACVV